MLKNCVILAAVILAYCVIGCALASAEALHEARAGAGLPALHVDARMTVMAHVQASRLAAQAWGGRCSMRTLNHAGFAPPAIAENVSCGCRHATCAIQRWLRSHHHRVNILMREARTYGVGSARSSSGDIYWAMELGQ